MKVGNAADMPKLEEDQATGFMHRIGDFPPARKLLLLKGVRTGRSGAALLRENFSQLTELACKRLKSMQRRPTLVTAFWKQAELPL
jgi:hypothetical protein